ncbi:LacI family DNA-binding transcriptional regulator [Anaerocolumna chitinilytica]|uniref:LacI family transcriptional regulator n=1 Tax=Anaerocolumna chitinilytica TaxID=1727145 RepID=A0A7I8DRD0_9FIRM|nr:LacI family DNA-binding transcriptional regulator [Anaerocolumna chitinilytica]BCK00981.1 LacI family transcriptional regulator [Anaerocolumna chitinilytica]
MKKATIKDVAKEAGVSISTVSNALNNSPLVSEDTKNRIIQIAENIKYVPNMNGKMLKARKSMTVGVFSSSVSGHYFYILVDSVFKELRRRGFGLNIVINKDKRALLSNVLSKNFDGIIVFDNERVGEHEVELIVQNQIKTVFLDRDLNGADVSSVLFDSYKSGYDLTKYLIHLGHKRIYFIEGEENTYDNLERKRGYTTALKEIGVEIKEEYFFKGMFEESYAYNDVISRFRLGNSQIPDAIVAANDYSAIGCIKAFSRLGYRVPEDISVVGFDDIEVARYFTPTLTTVRNPIARQGIRAVEILMDMMNNDMPGVSEHLAGEIIYRDSAKAKVL